MKYRKHQLSAWQVFSDVQMLIIMFFAMTLSVILLFVSINQKPTAAEAAVNEKVEYIISLAWDDARDDDLDLWLQLDHDKDAGREVLYYGNKELKNINLDRDSRGFITNKSVLEGGKVVMSENSEYITLRAIIPGDYLVATAYYDGHDPDTGLQYRFKTEEGIEKQGIDYIVKIVKVNPRITEIFRQKLHFSRVKESADIVAFHIYEDGRIELKPLQEGVDSLPVRHGADPSHASGSLRTTTPMPAIGGRQ